MLTSGMSVETSLAPEIRQFGDSNVSNTNVKNPVPGLRKPMSMLLTNVSVTWSGSKDDKTNVVKNPTEGEKSQVKSVLPIIPEIGDPGSIAAVCWKVAG